MPQISTWRGSWEEIGRGLGAAYRAELRAAIRRVKISPRVLRGVDEQVVRLMRHAPLFLSCLRGMRDASGVSLPELVAFVSWEQLLTGTDHCSTFFAEGRSGSPVIFHNEDENRWWKNRLHLARFSPKGAPSFAALHYAAFPPGNAAGMNEKGIVLTMNDLSLRKVKGFPQGVPPIAVGFSLLQSRTLADADALLRRVHVSMGAHMLVVDANGHARSAELLPHDRSVAVVTPGFFHTNHPITSLLEKEGRPSKSSVTRATTLAAFAPVVADADALLEVFQTPVRRGGVAQIAAPGIQSVTLATVRLLPAKREMTVFGLGKKTLIVRV